jgi:hypothetical protein
MEGLLAAAVAVVAPVVVVRVGSCSCSRGCHSHCHRPHWQLQPWLPLSSSSGIRFGSCGNTEGGGACGSRDLAKFGIDLLTYLKYLLIISQILLKI